MRLDFSSDLHVCVNQALFPTPTPPFTHKPSRNLPLVNLFSPVINFSVFSFSLFSPVLTVCFLRAFYYMAPLVSDLVAFLSSRNNSFSRTPLLPLRWAPTPLLYPPHPLPILSQFSVASSSQGRNESIYGLPYIRFCWSSLISLVIFHSHAAF